MGKLVPALLVSLSIVSSTVILVSIMATSGGISSFFYSFNSSGGSKEDGPFPLIQEAYAKHLPVQVDELYGSVSKVYDNRIEPSYLKIQQNFIDDTMSCEFCTRVEYVSVTQKSAAFALSDDTGFDLTGAKRIKFFIMGQQGGETISFKAAGKTLPGGKTMQDIMKNEKYQVYTNELKLEKKWQVIEIDLTGKDLKGITHPVAFEIPGAANHGNAIFYIKDVQYDINTPKNPVPDKQAPAEL